MTDWENIEYVRLRISDPAGFIDFETVEDHASLPATPAKQTAYRVESTGGYYETDLTAGATASDYDYVDIQISDAQILAIIEDVGLEKAVCRSLKRIAGMLGHKLTIKRNKVGADSTEYLDLLSLYKYYKNLTADCEEIIAEESGTNTGRYGGSTQPEIAGGNL